MLNVCKYLNNLIFKELKVILVLLCHEVDNHYFSFIVRMLREELQLLQEQGSYVGEVVKPMDKKKVLVKVRRLTVMIK